MSTGAIVAIIVVVLVVVAVLAVLAVANRRRRLRERFGPEYDRAVTEHDSKRQAEAELAERERRVRQLNIRPLEPAARARYSAEWTAVQEQFVDAPQAAVAGAQTLIVAVMKDRGYPTEGHDQTVADLSVEHAAPWTGTGPPTPSASAPPRAVPPPKTCGRPWSITGRCSPSCWASRPRPVRHHRHGTRGRR